MTDDGWLLALELVVGMKVTETVVVWSSDVSDTCRIERLGRTFDSISLLDWKP